MAILLISSINIKLTHLFQLYNVEEGLVQLDTRRCLNVVAFNDDLDTGMAPLFTRSNN